MRAGQDVFIADFSSPRKDGFTNCNDTVLHRRVEQLESNQGYKVDIIFDITFKLYMSGLFKYLQIKS